MLCARPFYKVILSNPPPPNKDIEQYKILYAKNCMFFKMGIGILSFAALKGGRDDPCFLHILTLKTVYDMNYRV